MNKFTESGYVELNPNLNDSYDMQTGEEKETLLNLESVLNLIK